MEPINYLAQVADPFAQAAQGLQLGAGMAELQQKQALMAQQQRQQQLAAQEQARFFSNPNPTMRDAARYASLLSPEQSNAFLPYMEGISKEQQQGTLKRTAQLLSSLQLNPSIAVDRLKQESEAARNSGDAEEAALFDRLATAAADPAQGAGVAFKALVQSASAIPGAKEMFETIDKGMGTAREEAKAPYELVKLSSEAIIKEQEAKFAPDKFLTDLNLTKQQIEQAKAAAANSRAAAAKSGAEAKRAEAEANQIMSGIVPAEKRPDLEGKMRKEYNDQTKPYQEVKSAYGRVLSSEDTAVGDLSLIFGYMKMLDPGSVVREGEFATAQNAAGVPERIMNIYNKVATGQRLSPSQRDSFKGQAKGLYGSALEGEKTVRTGLERISKGYGLNTNNIFYSATEQAPAGAPPAASANSVLVGGKTYTRPANFTDAQWGAYKQSVGAK